MNVEHGLYTKMMIFVQSICIGVWALAHPGQELMGCASYGVAGYQAVLIIGIVLYLRMQNAICCTAHPIFFRPGASVVVMQLLTHLVLIASLAKLISIMGALG